MDANPSSPDLQGTPPVPGKEFNGTRTMPGVAASGETIGVSSQAGSPEVDVALPCNATSAKPWKTCSRHKRLAWTSLKEPWRLAPHGNLAESHRTVSPQPAASFDARRAVPACPALAPGNPGIHEPWRVAGVCVEVALNPITNRDRESDLANHFSEIGREMIAKQRDQAACL